MSLNIVSKTYGGGDDRWMGSRHGVVNAKTGTLSASTFTGKVVKSGTPVIQNEQGLYTPAGTSAPTGFVVGDHDITGGDTPVPVMGGAKARQRGISCRCRGLPPHHLHHLLGIAAGPLQTRFSVPRGSVNCIRQLVHGRFARSRREDHVSRVFLDGSRTLHVGLCGFPPTLSPTLCGGFMHHPI